MLPWNHLKRTLLGLVVCALWARGIALSQMVATPTPAAVSNAGLPSAGVSPAVKPRASSPETPLDGLNFGLAENLEHDSSTAWSDFLTPNLSLRVNPNLSFDTSFPWYLTLAAYVPTTVNGVTTTTLTQSHNVIGDTVIAAHARAGHGDFNFSGGTAVGFATGDKSLGVSAGQTTYHFSTHADYSIGPFTPDLEAGIGNSSAFANRLVRKSYTAVGGIANFQAGTSIDLPKKLSLDVEGYEALPIELATVFGTISRRGNRSHGGGKKTLQGSTSSSEDNGLTMDLSFPLTPKLALSADYAHSLIQAEDIAGFSLTWVLRAPKKSESGVAASPLSRPAP